ncbi:histone-lysine N-methyltransferase SETD1B-like protein [Thalictrum thalictroides]|uniref:Histone-lysine N-methyltransferase SETD1B-like protein n=1 Tax=Thalictrum thalictroides TaxID=46969 RepID=A0A7J6V1H4_THATH|nr:histone-lysine N-methyltransferase SETD1B-like protein [Thalictrum thalictroides]
MATKHLKELLNEDQEPFVLKKYIDEKLQKSFSTPKSSLQIKKRKPISDNSSFSHNFCKNACFFSSSCSTTAYSPDIKKSPLFEFRSPLKSPCRNSNTLFVHIPARTAALLLEAALRIQKNNSVSKKTKSRKNGGFGLFGSFLKRIAYRKRSQKNESIETEKRVSVKDIIRWNSSNSVNFFTEERQEKEELVMGFEEKVISEIGLSCSCNSRRSSVWSESNEEKSFDLDTSSSRSEDSEDMEFVHQQTNNVVEDESRSLNNAGNTYEEEDKEQNSPVSVLDPPFEDDDDQEDEEAEKDHFKLESNYANVQRAKQQLLHKLRRFERLAELDPLELEKKIAEEEDEDIEGEEQYDDKDHLDNENVDSAFVRELLTQSNMYNQQKIPSDMKRLVLDLVAEERGDTSDPCSNEIVVEKVCKRLDAWKEVDSNTIDMMVEFDFRRDTTEWMKNPQEMQETAVDIEFAILGFLMEEISEELVQCSSF